MSSTKERHEFDEATLRCHKCGMSAITGSVACAPHPDYWTEPEPHSVAVNVDWADGYTRMNSWDVERCACDRPWKHGREYLA